MSGRTQDNGGVGELLGYERDSPNTPPSRAILLIDDDVDMTEMLSEYLASEGFSVQAAHDGDTGLKQAIASRPSLVVLDVMLPRMNGFQMLRRLRSASSVPVIMLTAKGDTAERILGLQSGADDYLAKPFDPEELVARVKAVLRRTSHQEDEIVELVQIGDVALNSAARLVRRGGAPVETTATEFDLLRALMRSAGRVLDRDTLLREVLRRSASPLDRSIDNHISSLRKKLGPAPDGRDRIRSIRNVGYLYTLPETASVEP